MASTPEEVARKAAADAEAQRKEEAAKQTPAPEAPMEAPVEGAAKDAPKPTENEPKPTQRVADFFKKPEDSKEKEHEDPMVKFSQDLLDLVAKNQDIPKLISEKLEKFAKKFTGPNLRTNEQNIQDLDDLFKGKKSAPEEEAVTAAAEASSPDLDAAADTPDITDGCGDFELQEIKPKEKDDPKGPGFEPPSLS